MRKQDIRIGAFYDWGGHVVEVIGIEPDGIVIECQEVGQDIVKPSSLKDICCPDDIGAGILWRLTDRSVTRSVRRTRLFVDIL